MSLGVQSWEKMTCAVCAWTMLADSDMSPVYTLPLVLCALVICYLQVRQPLRDWRKLGKCQKVIQHSPGDGLYGGVAVNSEGLLAVTDDRNKYIHIFRKEGLLMRSIGKGVSNELRGVTFDLKGNIWVVDRDSKQVLKHSQDDRLLQTIDHASSIFVFFIFQLSTFPLVCLSAQKVWFTPVIGLTTVSLSMMERACVCLLLGQREVALGVLMDLMM